MSTTFDCTDHVQRERGIGAAIGAIRRGELVVLPTDTVYGVAADAFSPKGVEGLLAAKGRGRDMPVPVLVSSPPMLEAIASSLPPAARALADAFWPGALTVVTRHTYGLAWDLGDTRGTVAVRMPDNALALDLIAETGPLAVSSANRSGAPAATTAAEAEAMLGEDVAVYLDGGPTEAVLPSTIVDVTGEDPRVLRVGAIDLERLREVVPGVQAS
jgi:L-threonylcarbamoyladenylate synthase